MRLPVAAPHARPRHVFGAAPGGDDWVPFVETDACPWSGERDDVVVDYVIADVPPDTGGGARTGTSLPRGVPAA